MGDEKNENRQLRGPFFDVPPHEINLTFCEKEFVFPAQQMIIV